MLKLQVNPIENNSESVSVEALDILSALFNNYDVDGIEVLEDGLLVYISEELWTSEDFEVSLSEWQEIIPFKYALEELPDINWNKEWESNFNPVFVDDFLSIKADFHDIDVNTQYTITINPKMSFGTGHHETTWMMSKIMSLVNFKKKKVLDAGSGTGILAILAKKLLADKVVAFDNDSWCYSNALENIQINDVNNIEVIDGSLEDIDESDFDIILANINRNFILNNGDNLASKLNEDALLIVSGFLIDDTQLILDYFHTLNMVAQYLITKGEWSCVILKR